MAYRQKHPYMAQLWYILKYLMHERLPKGLLNKTMKGKKHP